MCTISQTIPTLYAYVEFFLHNAWHRHKSKSNQRRQHSHQHSGHQQCISLDCWYKGGELNRTIGLTSQPPANMRMFCTLSVLSWSLWCHMCMLLRSCFFCQSFYLFIALFSCSFFLSLPSSRTHVRLESVGVQRMTHLLHTSSPAVHIWAARK